MVSRGDLVELAWLAADELLAGPYRKFRDAMANESDMEKDNERVDHKLKRMVKSASRFSRTELVGDEGTVSVANKIIESMAGEGACCVDWDAAKTLARMAATAADGFSSVSKITGG
jgi:hypothetical protein